MEHCDVLEEEEAEMKAMNRKVQKTKKNICVWTSADTNLLKEDNIKKQAEIEAVMIKEEENIWRKPQKSGTMQQRFL